MILNPLAYNPPFCTELDEVHKTDCIFASGLVALACSTTGEVVANPDWAEKNAKQLKALRERIRVKSGDLVGDASPADFRKGVQAIWPELTFPFYDAEPRTWDECMDLFSQGWAGQAIGNMKRAAWNRGNDVGHAIAVVRRADDKLRVMDPMMRDFVWVPASQVREFTDTFNGDKVKIGMLERGGQSAVARFKVKSDKVIGALRADLESTSQKLSVTKDKLTETRSTLTETRTELATTKAALAACEAQTPDCDDVWATWNTWLAGAPLKP